MKQKHWQVSVFNKTSETVRDDTFYTTDTEAYLVFELIDEDFTPDSATVTVYNNNGKATINASAEIADGIVQYEMPVDAIGHPGGWRMQVIYTKDNEDYTTKIIEFDVDGHLLDKKKPAIVAIENWNNFIKHAEGLIDDWEQLEEISQANETSRQANELVREEAESNRHSIFEANEAGRQSEFEENEQGRESAESERVVNEEIRQEHYDELIDTGIMEENIHQKLVDAEQQYAPRLTVLEQNDAEVTATKKILGSFKNNWFGVYAKSGFASWLYVDGVFDVSAFNDGLAHDVKVTGDLYCDDARVTNARSTIFVNDSDVVTDYIGTRHDSSYYAFKQKEIVSFDVDLSVVIKDNYFHHTLAFLLANNADFAGAFFRNLKITVDGVTIARISDFAPINSVKDSFVVENCFIVAQVDDIAPLKTDVETLKTTQNLKWMGKTWNVLGDSITAGGGVKYFSLIESKYGMTVNNYGVSGTGYSFRAGYDDSTSISNRFSTMQDDADLITVFAGTNDFTASNVPLGQLGDTTQTSFYGCVDHTFSGLIEKYPTKLIGVILPLQRSGEMSNAKGTLKQYVDAIREVAHKYSLPVLDLFNESNIYPNNPASKDAYMPDGLHPNAAGHTRISDKVLTFINSL